MNPQILAPIITGIFSLAATLAGVWFKDYLEQRRNRQNPVPDSGTRSEPIPLSPKKFTWVGAVLRAALLSGVVWVLGAISRSLRPWGEHDGIHYEALISFLVLFILSVTVLWQRRRDGLFIGQLRYQLELFGIWAGYAIGWLSVDQFSSVWDDLLAVQSGWWLAFALLGGMLLHLMVRRIAARGEVNQQHAPNAP